MENLISLTQGDASLAERWLTRMEKEVRKWVNSRTGRNIIFQIKTQTTLHIRLNTISYK